MSDIWTRSSYAVGKGNQFVRPPLKAKELFAGCQRMKNLGLYSAVVFGLVFGSHRVAEAAESHPLIEYRALKMEDFPIRAHVAPNLDAFTFVRMSYHMQQKTIQDGAMWQSEVVMMDIQCIMNPDKSWRRATPKDAAATLIHEQGHFDICEGRARQLRMQTLSSYPVGRGSDRIAAETDLDHALSVYFAKRYEELNREHRKYDKETKHGRTAAKQRAWTERLSKSVKE